MDAVEFMISLWEQLYPMLFFVLCLALLGFVVVVTTIKRLELLLFSSMVGTFIGALILLLFY